MSFIKVANAAENSYQFDLYTETSGTKEYLGRSLVIQGKHQRKIITNDPMITLVEKSDWDLVMATYGKYSPVLQNTGPFKTALVFALENDSKTVAKAADLSEVEVETGTKQSTMKDLHKLQPKNAKVSLAEAI